MNTSIAILLRYKNSNLAGLNITSLQKSYQKNKREKKKGGKGESILDT